MAKAVAISEPHRAYLVREQVITPCRRSAPSLRVARRRLSARWDFGEAQANNQLARLGATLPTI
jgi:hypothetical protein